MCLGAIYWARLHRIYYSNTRNDAAKIGFDDDFIYREIGMAARRAAHPGDPCCEQDIGAGVRRVGHQAGQAALLTGYFAACGSKPAFTQRSRIAGAVSPQRTRGPR